MDFNWLYSRDTSGCRKRFGQIAGGYEQLGAYRKNQLSYVQIIMTSSECFLNYSKASPVLIHPSRKLHICAEKDQSLPHHSVSSLCAQHFF